MRRTKLVLLAAASLVASLVAGLVAMAAPVAAQNGEAQNGDGLRYVALGDSYTAAPLVPQIIPAGGCFQSTHNYPHLLAAALQPAVFVDASCSGAQTRDMFASQMTGVAPQLDAVTPDTDLVTLSIGGNDSSVFGTLVGYCTQLVAAGPDAAPCRDEMRSSGGDRLFQAVALTQDRVVAVIEAIKDRAPDARIIVVGYPQIAPRHGSCPALLPLAAGDLRYANQVNQRLTLALRHAAAQQHVEYVDVWRASQGHDICSADPWINGQHTDVTRAQAFHPFAEEQAAVADLVLAELG
jgi:lysophospholipase L1-like esterase